MDEETMIRLLALSQEEALGLLEIAMTSAVELNRVQRTAILKLSDYCRGFIRLENQPLYAQEDNVIYLHLAA